MSNTEIARLLEELGDLLELQGENPFRVRAYRNAARVVAGHPRALAELVAEGFDPDTLPRVGEAIAQKIRTIVATGHLPALEEAAKRTPRVLADLMKVPGLGPKRVKTLHTALSVRSVSDLRRAAMDGRLRDLPGFGAKLEQRILEALRESPVEERRFLLSVAEDLARSLTGRLAALPGVLKVDVAGSLRRRKETVGDLDILVTCRKGAKVIDELLRFDAVASVSSHGSTRATVHLRSGIQVDVRVIPQVSYGAALCYFTGSKAHNVALRQMGQTKGLKINEYGVYRGNERIAGEHERDVFAAVGLPWIAPELREDAGEIQAALSGRLPVLISVDDLKGDLHTHTRSSDGLDSLENMAAAALQRGYEYLAVTDHSQSVRIARGLDPKRTHAHLDDIERYNAAKTGLTLLKSSEVDILKDGSLDMPDEILKRLNIVVAALHFHLDLPARRQSARILKAMDKGIHILAHPTGRLIGEREPAAFDMEAVMKAAAERNIALEVNGQPSRLDLNDQHCRLANQFGVRLSIASDAHSTADLDKIRFGVDQARRGWIEADEVLNTLPLGRLTAWLGGRH